MTDEVLANIDPALLSREIAVAFSRKGRATFQGGWRDWDGTTVQDLVVAMSRHKEVADKDGSCILQGAVVDKKRAANSVKHLDLLILDLDTGESMDALLDKVRARGLFCIAYTTFSHMKDTSDVAKDAVVKRMVDKTVDPTVEDVVSYLRDVKRYQPAVLEGAVLVGEEHKSDGLKLVVRHQPMEKFRLVFVLKERFIVGKRGPTHRHGLDEWKSRYIGLAQSLGAYFDRSCTDPSRLFYTPAHAKDKPWRVEIVPGEALDLDLIEGATPEEMRGGVKIETNAFTEAGASMGGGRGRKVYKTPFLFDFVAKHGGAFECDTFLQEVLGEDRGPRSGGQHGHTFCCPNDDEHSNAGDPDDVGFFAVNSSESTTKGFIAHCMHDSCAELDRVDFLDLTCQAVGIDDAFKLQKWCVEFEEEEAPSASAEAPKSKPTEVKAFSSSTDAKKAIAAMPADDEFAAEEIAARIAVSKFSVKTTDELKNLLVKTGAIGKASFNAVAKKAQKAEEAPKGNVDIDDETRKALMRYNEMYCVVRIGGKVKILVEPNGERTTPDFLDTDAFKTWTANDKILVVRDGENKMEPTSKLWLEWENRRACDEVVFEPALDAKGTKLYNIWKGFPVEPKRGGSWQFMKDHIKENICQGNEEHYQWLMTWVAQMFQQPGIKLGSSVVIRGKKGTGKSKFFDWVRRPMGPYATKISHRSQITGNFNSHQFGKVLIVAEEALWAGDKEAGGVLKDMITSPTMQLEKKGVDAVEVSNYARLAFISNEAWVVPAGLDDERRFFVLDCGNNRKEDFTYFGALEQQMLNGGMEAMVYDMMHWQPPGGNWNILRRPPQTAGLREQGLHSMDVADRFFLQMIEDGGCFRPDMPDRDIELYDDDPTIIPVQDLRAHFERAVGTTAQGKHYLTNPSFLREKAMKWLLASDTLTRCTVPNHQSRQMCFQVPSLKAIREPVGCGEGKLNLLPKSVDDEADQRNKFTVAGAASKKSA